MGRFSSLSEKHPSSPEHIFAIYDETQTFFRFVSMRGNKVEAENTASIINDNTSKSSNIYYRRIYCDLIRHIKQNV